MSEAYVKVIKVQGKVRRTIGIEKGRSGVWLESCIPLLPSLISILLTFYYNRGINCQGKEFGLILRKEIHDENQICLTGINRQLSKDFRREELELI